MLVRYWFEFDFTNENIPYGLSMGCGLTAYNHDDAISLLNEHVFKDIPIPKIKKFIENIDISTLDAGHILPNMLPPNLRGVWFPLGFNVFK
jgi:hypothetical protein